MIPRKDYFEGVLQLRNPTEELLDFVWNQIEKAEVYVAKEIPHKRGVDLYLSSNKFLHQLAKKLAASFKGQLKKTATLHTRDRQSSKEKYRVTVLFEIPPFKQGDMIQHNGDTYKVISISSKLVLADVNTGRKKSYKFDDVVAHMR